MATWELVSIDSVEDDGSAYVTIDVKIPYPTDGDPGGVVIFRQQLLGIQTKSGGTDIAAAGVSKLDDYTTSYEEEWLTGRRNPGEVNVNSDQEVPVEP
jgi:hypothetical protein